MARSGSSLRPPVLAALALALVGSLEAAVPPPPVSALALKEFFAPELSISSANVPLEDALPGLANRPAWAAFLHEHAAEPPTRRPTAFIDRRSGAATSVVLVFPLLPGTGDGNGVSLDDVSRRLGRDLRAIDEAAVADLVLAFATSHAAILGIDPGELAAPRARLANPDLWHVRIPQVHRGIPVRHAQLVAVVSHGNLVLVGTETWGAVRADTTPALSADDALALGFAFAYGRRREDLILAEPRLELVPVATGGSGGGAPYLGPIGAGYAHRLAWSFRFQRPPEGAQWEVLVDAATGEVFAFEDRNQYVTRQATGGVYPVTNTDVCPTPQTCGIMQRHYPMPWADTGRPAPNDFANAAGVFDYTSGIASSALAGRFVRMSDACGPISLSSPAGILAFGGAPGQHDCATPGVGGAGNTAASRTTFYELNRIKELARGWLPANTWLQAAIDANVNIAQSCAAFWNGTSVNFYRSGAACRNTGEIAGTVDHEWGHGMDRFDTGGVLSNSSEGYGDIAAMLRLQSSCIGYGFFRATSPPGACGLTADGTGNNANEAITGAPHCDTDCSGVRDGDWAKHVPPTPDTALGFVCSSCTTGSGPCGRQVHCAAAPARQAAWDLPARDLQAAPFNLDLASSFIVANRIFYQGSGLIGAWHACTCGGSSSGCGATNAYMQWIAADDDNGNLADGTPHMTALFAAFDRHQIACATPAPVNSGCAGGPSTAPGVTIAPNFDRIDLSWTPVPGATRYWVFRADGHAGCDQGKALIAEVTGLGYTDFQVASGLWHWYNVVAAGASNACFGPASGCLGAAPGIQGDFGVACTPAALTISPGGTGTSGCTVQSTSGFTAAVELSCAGLPANADCVFDPAIVAPPANGVVGSTLTVSVGASVPQGTYNFFVYGESGGLTRGSPMTLTVSALSVAPQALAVDTSGNGVYQPSETVVVAPTWRNAGTLALVLDGTLGNHTGPAGPTYSIPDPTASYGTIAVGGNASCGGNCYSVANVAATRPQTHWDTTAEETVFPTGTIKTWTLHVGDSFTEVPQSNPFYRFIEMLLHRGVTGGCTPTTYCPSSSTTREQMAVFVILSKEPPGYVPPACVAGAEAFNDVPATSPFCRWIEELSRRGVVSGCGNGAYCPGNPVTREQMAIFVLKTLDPALVPPPCAPPNLYLDVPESSPFCRWIEELTVRGVVSGCGGGNYCPGNPVTREQMGVFLAVTFGLTLYGL